MNFENQSNNSFKRNLDRVDIYGDRGQPASEFELPSKQKKLNNEEIKCEIGNECGKNFDDSGRVQLLHFLRVRNPFQSSPAQQKIEPKMIEETPTKDYEFVNRYLYFTKKENLLQKGLISPYNFQEESQILDFDDIIQKPMPQRNDNQMEMDIANDVRNYVESYYRESNQCLNKIYFERKSSRMGE